MVRNTLRLLAVAAFLCNSALLIAADPSPAVDATAAQLKMEARLAAEQGDFTTALHRIREAAEQTGDRATVDRTKQIASSKANGGNSFADFGALITLIQEQTSPPARWSETDGEGGTISITEQGVLIASQSVLASLKTIQDDSHLQAAAEFAKRANHNADVRQASNLRMVSLPRLEAYVTHLTRKGQPVTEDIHTLAGLSQIKYLFMYPETGDIVIAGPAGDWAVDANGRTISQVNSRPTLNLDDLMVLTQTFGKSGIGGFVCTIDPKKDQIAAVQEYTRKNRRGLTPQSAKAFTETLEQTLGLQNVFVQGVPHDSRIASVIVEADYRMKEIGIGRRQGPQGMKSYFDLLTRSEQRGSGSMDALRWWMAVGYDAVNTSPNGKVFELAGNAIQCLSENQIVNSDGNRQGTGKASRANAKFAQLFTKHLPALAEQDVVFADLENVFDLAMVSALVHSHGLADQVGWQPNEFAGRGDLKTESYEVPTELMTAAEFRVYDGRNVVIQVAGGVRAELSQILRDKDDMVTVEELNAQSLKATPLGQQNGRWWWDAAAEK